MLASASNCAFAESTVHVSCTLTALLALTSRVNHVAAQTGGYHTCARCWPKGGLPETEVHMIMQRQAAMQCHAIDPRWVSSKALG